MANFEVYEKCAIKSEGVTIESIGELLKTSLAKYYKEDDITVTPSGGVTVKGNLKSIWERAITTAEAKIKIDGGQLTYRVDGDSSFGSLPWVWFILGFFTGFMFIWFLLDLVEYIMSRDRPKRYFEEAFKSVQFEIG